ncbi:hypothetical protein HDU84_002288 [Entophlyctis sp. JEL0112]|nr:hypothetical protein HDU84_002288 [Entophlyctis sp. JEL0112]
MSTTYSVSVYYSTGDCSGISVSIITDIGECTASSCAATNFVGRSFTTQCTTDYLAVANQTFEESFFVDLRDFNDSSCTSPMTVSYLRNFDHCFVYSSGSVSAERWEYNATTKNLTQSEYEDTACATTPSSVKPFPVDGNCYPLTGTIYRRAIAYNMPAATSGASSTESIAAAATTTSAAAASVPVAAIAGGVVGSLVAVAVAAGALVWWYARRRHQRPPAEPLPAARATTMRANPEPHLAPPQYEEISVNAAGGSRQSHSDSGGLPGFIASPAKPADGKFYSGKKVSNLELVGFLQ